MIHYKDEEGNVYGFESDAEMNQYRPGLIKMTEEEFEAFRNPPPGPAPIPQEIEGWQAEVVMRVTKVGEESVWDRVQELSDGLADESQKITARVVLQRGKLRRDSALLAQLSPLVPLTQEQVDDMFVQGSQIEA